MTSSFDMCGVGSVNLKVDLCIESFVPRAQNVSSIDVCFNKWKY